MRRLRIRLVGLSDLLPTECSKKEQVKNCVTMNDECGSRRREGDSSRAGHCNVCNTMQPACRVAITYVSRPFFQESRTFELECTLLTRRQRRLDMGRHAFARHAVAVIIAVCAIFSAGAAGAGTPTVVWQKSGVQTGDSTIFSTDGTALLLSVTGGFELRRASDGVLLNTLTLPADSLGYDAKALSPDKTLVALSFLRSGGGTIELWRIAGSTLARTITTDAVRTIKGLAFSSTGLIASRERFAYGGGGNLRVHRVSDGTLVKKAGPVARNSARNGVGFSADGTYLAVNDDNQSGLWILRTSDWSTARLISGATLFAWADNT